LKRHGARSLVSDEGVYRTNWNPNQVPSEKVRKHHESSESSTQMKPSASLGGFVVSRYIRAVESVAGIPTLRPGGNYVSNNRLKLGNFLSADS
jgi:hypothetical protein